MQISALNSSSQSFKSNTPIYHVYVRHKDGTQSELPNYQIKGPALGLVKRLNDFYSREAEFLRGYIDDFESYPVATSSIVGRNDIKKKHIIYGEDAYTANELREDCYKNGNTTKEDVSDTIHRSLIDPISKKVRLPRYTGDPHGEQVGLVLYTDEINSNYKKLNGLALTSIDGRVFAELPRAITEKELKAAARKEAEAAVKREAEAAIAQKEKEQAVSAPQVIEEQPDLLGFEMPEQPKKHHADPDAIQIRKRWKH